MPKRIWRFIWGNLSSLILAFALAFAVWISAVVAADPNEQRVYPKPLELEVSQMSIDLILIGDLPGSISIDLSAPASLWDRIVNEADVFETFIDLSGLGAGEHMLPVQVRENIFPVRIISIDPAEVKVILESRDARTLDVAVNVFGTVALGFQIEDISLSNSEARISGPSSKVAEVDQIVANLDVNGERESHSNQIDLLALDADGNEVFGLTLLPSSVDIQIAIVQAGGYREVAVAVETFGQPSQGFRVIDISVTPPIITLFSDDIQLIEGLPGFVSTLPLDLTDAQGNIESRLALNLPDGVSVEGEQQNVLVVIGIAPIESSIPISVTIEIIGLAAGTSAEISPESVNLILAGPLAILESLAPGDVRLLVDVSELEAGPHLLGPRVEILPEDVEVLSVTPSSVEIVISIIEAP